MPKISNLKKYNFVTGNTDITRGYINRIDTVVLTIGYFGHGTAKQIREHARAITGDNSKRFLDTPFDASKGMIGAGFASTTGCRYRSDTRHYAAYSQPTYIYRAKQVNGSYIYKLTRLGQIRFRELIA